MAIIDAMQSLERIQFFNGQRLFASDLQGLESFNREMRWLHNQSLHQAGVGSGFAVVGNKDDRQVTVSAGYALDSLGREIVQTKTVVVAIPPVADNGAGGPVFYDLTVSYPDDADLKPSETREGICLPPGVIRLQEEPVFCWVRLNDDPKNPQPVDTNLKTRIKSQLFIVLARVEIFNCKLKQPVSTKQRRNARPPKQPRVACGTFSPQDWTMSPAGIQQAAEGLLSVLPVQFSTRIDTTSGGFAATPCYFARLSGDRLRIGLKGSLTPPPFQYIADGLIEIADQPAPTPTSFFVNIYPVVVNFGNHSAANVLVDVDFFRGSKVTWFGVED